MMGLMEMMGLRQWLAEGWNGTRQDTWSRAVMAALGAALGPAALLYRLGYETRRAGYARGLLRPARLPCPVVSVGNLTVGGTGKTSLVARLARRLLDDGLRVAVISRGYGGRYPGPYAVVSDGRHVLLQAAEAGDEPVMLARRLPGLWVVVGRDRSLAAEATLQMARPDVILLDDGFQSWEVARDLDLVVVDGVAGFGSGRLQPAGPLREPLAALGRASGIVVTKTDQAGPPDLIAPLLARLRATHPAAPIWRGWYRVADVRRFGTDEPVAPETLRGMAVALLSGIADPRGFRQTVETLGVEVVTEARYPDHYRYRPADLVRLAGLSLAREADSVLTTEKDAVRIDRWPGPPPLAVVRVELEVERGPNGIDDIDDVVESAIHPKPRPRAA